MGFSSGDDFDHKEKQVVLVDEPRQRSDMDHGHGVEFELEFWPVEHPLEPQDEDRPVKCPMPTSSVINESRMQEDRLADSLGKRTEVSTQVNYKEGNIEDPPPVRAVRKRHHTLTHEDHIIKPLMKMPPLPPLPTQKITIFEMLQEFDKFES